MAEVVHLHPTPGVDGGELKMDSRHVKRARPDGRSSRDREKDTAGQAEPRGQSQDEEECLWNEAYDYGIPCWVKV